MNAPSVTLVIRKGTQSLATGSVLPRFLIGCLLLTALPTTFANSALLASPTIYGSGGSHSVSGTQISQNVPQPNVHPPNWGDEAPDSPIPLQSPFAAGSSIRVAGDGTGNFYGDGDHTNIYNDYYATDWAVPPGTPVFPVAEGVVSCVGWTCGGLGYAVTITHNRGVETTYGHLQDGSASNLQVGDHVYTSMHIGNVGCTFSPGGACSGPHLHLRFRVNGYSYCYNNGNTCPDGEYPKSPQSPKPSPIDGQKLIDGQYILAASKNAPPSGEVSGSVKYGSGQAAGSATVKIVNGSFLWITSTSSNGWYDFPSVPAGAATISAVKDGSGGFRNVTVVRGQSQVVPDIILNSCVPPGSESTIGTGVVKQPDIVECGPGNVDGATFIRDVNYGDNPPTVVSPGQNLTKIWLMQNSGTSTWGTGYQLVFRHGDQLGAPSAVNAPAATPGQQVNLSMPLQIPGNISPGRYQGYWQLRNAQGVYFGPEIWYIFQVGNSQQPPGNGVNVSLGNINSPSQVTPGLTWQPQVTVNLISGQLLQSRGDMLRFYSGTNYTNPGFDHVAVVGTVNPSQNYTFQFYPDHPFQAPATPGTYTSGWRVWANNGWVGPEIDITFSVYTGSSGRPPNKPSLVSPYDWQLFVGQTPQLCAHDNGDPDGNSITGFDFQIYNSAQNWDSGWVSSSCVTPPSLGNYGYQWHVKVRDSTNQESEWSDTWHFNIESSTVTITSFYFEPPSPSNTNPIVIRAGTSGCGGVGVDLKALVNTAADGSANGTWVILKELGVPAFNEEDAPRWDILDYQQGPHLARIEARSCDGTVVSQDQQYTILRAAPGRPFLQSPSNGFWSNSRTITFQWQASLRASNYTLIVGTTQDPEQSPVLTVQSLNATQYTYTFSQDYTRLYWRVYANNELGRTVQDGWWVGIDRTPPTSAINTTITLPVSHQTQFPVSWNGADADSGVQNYDVQVQEDSTGQWVDWLTAYPYQSAIFTGEPGHTYYFRTSADDIAGNTEAYPTTADAQVLVDTANLPPQTWWNNNYQFKRTIVVANRLSGAVVPAGYPVHLHFDSSTSPTAADIYNASLAQSTGDDVRVVYNDQTELNRQIPTFNASAIDIWFQVQADIPANDSSSAYYVYYGNGSPGAPPASLTSVYAPSLDAQTGGLWYFEEPSGTTNDLSGHGNNISWSSDPQHSAANGRHGSGVQLNGSQWGTINSPTNMGSQLTVEGWVLFDSLTNPANPNNPYWTGAIGKYSAADHSNRWRITLFNGGPNNSQRMRADLETIESNGSTHGYGLVWDSDLQTGRWYHVALTYDGGTVRFWVDGNLVTSQAAVGNVDDQGDPVYFGRNNPMDPPLVGRLDGWRVSNAARTSFPYGQVTVDPSVAAGQQLTPQSVGPSDLAVQNLDVLPNPDGSMLVQAVLQNIGQYQTYNEFYDHLYINHVPTGPNDFTNSVSFWVDSPIAPGAVVTLTTILSQPQAAQLLGRKTLAPQTPGGEQIYNFAAQVDSTGVLNDVNRSNNITSGVQYCVASTDAYEPDNASSQASTMSVGESQVHNIDKGGDQDWVKFQAQAGQSYMLNTSNLGASADTYLYLYGTDATTLLASNDDYNGTTASHIDWVAPTTGTYYVLVKQWNPAAQGCGQAYTLTIAPPTPPCNIQFEDVTATNPFYPFVQCIACHSIIAGYNCGGVGEPCDGSNNPYFRPGVNVTRGQIAKMVALAAGLTDSVGTQTFEDVPPTNPFYLWIQQLSGKGYISGYACGGAGEPCNAGGAGNSPYFRPGQNTTRGQLTKIVSNAAGLNDVPASQTFTDVPTTAPFYVWVERLSSRGIISGYTCGSAGEACDAQQRPYFRVNNNVTRGQTAKIVSNTFFPNCQMSAAK